MTALVLLAFLAACEAPTAEPRVAVVTDSAGVSIVTSEPGRAGAVTLAERLVVIGEGEGDGQNLFRVNAVRMRPGGALLVAEGGSGEVREYGRDGGLQRTVGGRGDGPGEFRNPGSMQFLPGERLRVLDYRARRATVFGEGWEVDGTVPFELPSGSPSGPDQMVFPGSPLAFTSRGGLVGFPGARVELEGRAGRRFAVANLRRFDPDGDPAAGFGAFRLMSFLETPDGVRPAALLPGSARLIWDVRDLRLALSEGLAHDIAVLDDGVPTLRIREDRPRLPNPAPDTLEVPPSDSLPSYEALTVDADGRVWARAGTPADADSAQWRRFGPEGALEASLTLPARDRVLDARGDTVVLLRFDSLDVERVEVWRTGRGS